MVACSAGTDANGRAGQGGPRDPGGMLEDAAKKRGECILTKRVERVQIDGPGVQFVLEPAAIQDPSAARSASVISVILFSGIVWVFTAWAKICLEYCRICAGVSNITPFGGSENAGNFGCAEWQIWQRWSTMMRTSVKLTGFSAVALGGL